MTDLRASYCREASVFGAYARRGGEPLASVPHAVGTAEHRCWTEAWRRMDREMREGDGER